MELNSMQVAFNTWKSKTKPKLAQLREIRLKNKVMQSDLAQVKHEMQVHT
jgi:hypothetical protein